MELHKVNSAFSLCFVFQLAQLDFQLAQLLALTWLTFMATILWERGSPGVPSPQMSFVCCMSVVNHFSRWGLLCFTPSQETDLLPCPVWLQTTRQPLSVLPSFMALGKSPCGLHTSNIFVDSLYGVINHVFFRGLFKTRLLKKKRKIALFSSAFVWDCLLCLAKIRIVPNFLR